MVILGLLCLIALVVVTLTAAAEEEGLYLGPISYDQYDSDSDGLVDSVKVTATVINGNDTNSRIFTVAAILNNGTTRVAIQSNGDQLQPLESVNMTLRVGTKTTSMAGPFTLVTELHEEDLSGPIKSTAETTVNLYPLGEYDLDLTVNRSAATGIENTSVEFTLQVLSLSNNPTDVDLTVVSNLGWSYILDMHISDLEPSGEATAVLEVLVPHNAPPNTLETLTVEAIAARNTSAFSSQVIKVSVAMERYEVSMLLTETHLFVASGETVTVTGFVTNHGNNQDNITLAASAPVGWTVAFEPPQVLLDRDATAGFEVLITAPIDLAKAGTLDLNVTAFSTGMVKTATITVEIIYNTAELFIDAANVTTSPKEPVAGEEVTFQAYVVNAGVITVSDVDVILLAGEEEVARVVISSITPGSIGIASLKWTAIPGTQLVRLMVDPDEKITELDETNNRVSVTITATSADLAVMPTDISIEPAYPTEGSDVLVTVVVWNLKGVATGPFDILISVNDTTIDTHHVEEGLLGNANVSVSVAWTAVPGRPTFKVEVDPDGDVLEEDRSNNAASRSFSMNRRPVAVLVVSATEVDTGEIVALDASGSLDPDGRVRQYLFDYGDGSDSGWTFFSKINHSFSKAGKYEIHLYVRDEMDAQNVDPETVIVMVSEAEGGNGSTPGPVAMVALLALLAVALPMVGRRRGDGG